MEISETKIGIFYISKIFALAPFSLRRNHKGVMEIYRSTIFSVYSISLALIMVVLTYHGLMHDANSKMPVRASFRMKSATSKVVTALDVSVVVLGSVSGIGCGVLGLRSTQELNFRLRKIDESLHSFSNYKHDRIVATIITVFPLLWIGILLGLDVWTWLRFASNMKKNGEDTADMNVHWYIPFYSLYLILTALHINFSNTSFGLYRRYRRLNLMLTNSFLKDHKKEQTMSTKGKITTVKGLMQSTMPLNVSLSKCSAETLQFDAGTKTKSILIRLMAENHESLGKCVLLVSGSYGVTVLFILVSCLLHLVATSYFLFLELLNTKDDGFVWVQILWIAFHTFRLLMVVEPCHLATAESKKTILIICEIERVAHDPILIEEVKKFWQQLLVINSEFSAYLCRVNRNILTSFSSAIATYLVILIQFQNTNG